MAKVKIKFNPVRDVIQGKSVVVVDDSLVRGNTSQSLVQMIRAAGAREVHLRLGSPPITGPCLLRHRHAHPGGAHRRHPFGRGDPRSSWASTRSATCRSTACCAPPARATSTATPASPGSIPHPIPGDLVQLRHASPLVATPA